MFVVHAGNGGKKRIRTTRIELVTNRFPSILIHSTYTLQSNALPTELRSGQLRTCRFNHHKPTHTKNNAIHKQKRNNTHSTTLHKQTRPTAQRTTLQQKICHSMHRSMSNQCFGVVPALQYTTARSNFRPKSPRRIGNTLTESGSRCVRR